jgi:hypothetical protein
MIPAAFRSSSSSSLFLAPLVVAALVGCSPAEASNPTEEVEGQASELSSRADAECTVFHRTACLVNSSRSSRKITVNYPGLSWCKMSFVPSGYGWDPDLAKDLEFSLGMHGQSKVITAEQTEDGLTVDLGSEMLYVDVLTVRTKSGQSLDKVIRSRLDTGPHAGAGPSTLVAIPTKCPGR